MSYFIKYKLSFVSDRGNVYDLHILQKNYAGQPIVKKLGVAPVLSIEDGEGRVKGSSLSFAVQADVEGELKGLYTTNNKEFKVLLYRNSSLYWQGFVLPELYSENYIDPPYDVAVTASDQLGVLKNVEYKQEAGYKSLLEIIAYTLSLTDLDLKIVQHLNLTLSGNERFLDGAYVATEGYYGQSCYDVLNSILLSCNACIQQYGNEWVIMSLTDVSTSYNKDGVNIEIPHAQLGQMGSAQVYPDGSLEMVNKPAVKGVTLNYAHVLKNSFLKNADCQSKDGWQYSFEPLDNRFPGAVDEFGVIYKCNCWQLPQKDVTVSGELQLWQDVNVKADNTYNCQLSVDYRMDVGASLLLMAIIHEGVDGITRRLTSEGWKEGVSDTDRNSYINVTGTPSELWLTWAKDIADFSKYEKTTVQFRLPDVDGVLRIGFINTSETSSVNPLSGYVYITKVYLTYMGITGKASTTVVEEDATNAQEEISLAYGERVPATNEALAVLNTLRSASGVPREQFSLNNTSGVKSYDSYFLAMLQEMSRYYAVKKMHLQGVVMGVSPLHLLYKDVFSGKVMRLVSGEYDLLQDTLGVLLEEVPDAWVDYEPEVYATDNSVPGVSSSGVVTVGGGGGTSLLAVNAKGEVYVKDERVLSGAEADFGKVVLPAEKPEESSDKVYIYSQVPAADEQLDNKAVNVHLMVDELVELRDDFDALNDLLNSDVAGVINTWDEIVDFLNEYGESQDLASILSQMNTDIANRVLYTDFEKLEDAVDSNYKSISNIASTIPTIESNIFALTTRVGGVESVITTIQATYVDKASAQEINGVKTFKNGLKIGEAELVWDSTNKALKIVGSAYITKDLSFGGYQAPEGGGTSGGGIVTIKVNGQEYTSQNGIVTLPNYPSLAGYATEDYVTSRGYITNAALNGYAKLTDIPASLPASDVYAWAKAATKPAYTASEIGALSVSGGTITISSYQGITIKRASTNATPLLWFSNNNGNLGAIGFNANKEVVIDNTSTEYTLIHSGNYSDYALPLSGGTIDGVLKVNSDFYTNNVRFNREGVTQILSAYAGLNHDLSYYDGATWERIITTKNIGSYNAGSATKLQTARTIWGQSFDGTGDISAAPSFPSYLDVNRNADTGALLDSSKMGFEIETYANDARFKTYTSSGSNTSHLVLSYAGNVLIGDATDSGSKLSIYANGASGRIKIYSSGTEGLNIGQWDGVTNRFESYGRSMLFTAYDSKPIMFGFSGDGDALFIDSNKKIGVRTVSPTTLFEVAGGFVNPYSTCVASSAQISLGQHANDGLFLGYGTIGGWIQSAYYGTSENPSANHTYPIVLNPLGGNVLIGTTTDTTGKLQVAGAINITNEYKIGGLDVLRKRTNYLAIGEETTVYGLSPTHIYGTDVVLRYSTSGYIGFTLNSSGNVLIGTTTDGGYKLDVNGSARFGSNAFSDLSNVPFIVSNAGYYNWNAYIGNTSGGVLIGYKDGIGQIGVNSNRNLAILPDAGNVLIGTTSDNGGKLQVSGDIAANSFSSNPNDYHVANGKNIPWYGLSVYDAYNKGVWLSGYTFVQIQTATSYFKVGQGSVDTNASVNIYGNLTVTGDITFGSDARYKNKITDVEIDLATIANAPLFIYKWNDREDDREHLGTTAQYWFDTAFKNAVIPTNDEKLWTMSYSEIAIGNTIILAREQIKVKSRVEVLEEKVKQLEDELEKYRRVA